LIEFDQTFGTAGYEPAFWLCHWLYLMTWVITNTVEHNECVNMINTHWVSSHMITHYVVHLDNKTNTNLKLYYILIVALVPNIFFHKYMTSIFDTHQVLVLLSDIYIKQLRTHNYKIWKWTIN
jgi:hypothetical protein